MKVAIVGAGRVGLVSGLVLYELGHEVMLFDVDPTRVESLRRGVMPFFEPGAGEILGTASRNPRWTVTLDPMALGTCETVLITVPTPAAADGGHDLRAVRSASETLAKVRAASPAAWRAVFLRSTVTPGITVGVVGEALSCGPTGGQPCPVGYLPEFLREGSALADARHPDRIVVGADDPAVERVARDLLGGLGGEFVVMGIRTAELAKLANNAFLSTCVSFSNEIARIAEALGDVDAMRVFEGVHLDRRFGGSPRAGIVDYLVPGPGFGGSCLTKDLAALASFARTAGESPVLLEAVQAVNDTQPLRFVEGMEAALGGLAGRDVLVLGLAFKPGTDDLRDSIAIPILRELVRRGARVCAHDPVVSAETGGLPLDMDEVELLAGESVAAAMDEVDAVVLVSAWNAGIAMLREKLATRTKPMLFADARGALRGVRCSESVTYLGVGLGPRGRSADG